MYISTVVNKILFLGAHVFLKVFYSLFLAAFTSDIIKLFLKFSNTSRYQDVMKLA